MSKQGSGGNGRFQATQIRRRLFWLLFKVFGAVALTALLLLAGLLAIMLRGPGDEEASFPPEQLAILKTYYLVQGSWEGVAALWDAPPDDSPETWQQLVLLDENGRVLSGPAELGELYESGVGEVPFTVQVADQTVGTLILTSPLSAPPLFVVLGAVPLVTIAVSTALVTLLIGFLLTRRIVTPLAEVIAAAQEVTAGDLSARAADVSGPDDFRALGDAFNQMVDTLQANEEQRRNMLADIAHELRTPLTILRGRLEGILDGIYEPDEAHIAPAVIQTHLLQKLVDDLRLLTLAETGHLPIAAQDVYLDEIAAQTAVLFEAEALDKNVTLTVATAPDLPAVTADPQRVGQVVSNLLSNALRHVPDGGHIAVAVQREGNGVALSVADSGAGVPEEDLPHLFDRFWRAEKSRNRSSGGAGLGLAIVKQLVLGMNGRIHAENTPGSGLRVTVYFNT
ncbi:MAG: HAMP domain-containing protein [Ardenticatenaceae bacterium]|nr:HAMP domain-containing protein [Ardenticatenaceae bacterium]